MTKVIFKEHKAEKSFYKWEDDDKIVLFTSEDLVRPKSLDWDGIYLVEHCGMKIHKNNLPLLEISEEEYNRLYNE